MKTMVRFGLMASLMSLLMSCQLGTSLAREDDPDEALLDAPDAPTLSLIDQVDLSVQPNEAGDIMILMYHTIGSPEALWTRTVENFKHDLAQLYQAGYRPISLRSLVHGTIDLPAGMSPVVLTFDDASRSHFRLLEDGLVDPDSAVGILLDFHAQHPDFEPKATFFVSGLVPFGQAAWVETKLNLLLSYGMDLGNHTLDHPNLSSISAEALQAQLAQQARRLENWIHDETYRIDTFALPYGSRPRDAVVQPFLISGSYDGFSYQHVAVLNVGSGPVPSPYTQNFNPYSLARIRASTLAVDGNGLYDVLARFEEQPWRRYISDGVMGVISAPRSFADRLRSDLDQQLNLYD